MDTTINNDVLKSIKEEMEIKEKEFNQVVDELTILEQNYKTRKTQLESAKEQIRGAYTALYQQLQKFAADQLSKPEIKQVELEQEVKKDIKPKATKSTKKETSTEKVVAGLTPEEIAKINKAVPQQNMKDSNGNDIPDYLQQEYNK